MLSFNNFSYHQGSKTILNGLNFTVKQGELLSIIGPNGAGKSTLLKCIIRINSLRNSSGSAQLAGKALQKYNQKALARLVSYVPQATGEIPPFTVAEFINFSRYAYNSAFSFNTNDIAKNKQALAVTERAMELTGVQNFASRQLSSLSGGERQKVYVAAALAQDTPLMLLDEPTSFLDPRHAFELKALLQKLMQQQTLSILHVTHDLNFPLEVGGNTLILANGEQLYLGDSAGISTEGVLEHAFKHKFIRLKHPQNGKAIVFAS